MSGYAIIRADARRIPLMDGCVNCCVTSPPYWGLRDYGIAGQLGLETTPDEYVAGMVAVFREVRRVLKDDGVAWVNLGDCYATGAGKVGECSGGGEQGDRWKGHRGSRDASPKNAKAIGPMCQPNRMPLPGLKPKDLIGIPWRVAFALQADGWYLRSDIIWSKPNPMPESVTDRPTKAHEYIFLLSKSERYWYDAEAIAEPTKADTLARYERGRSDEHKWADGGPGNQTIAKSFSHMRSGNKARKPASARGVPVDTGGSTNGAVAGSVPWEDKGVGRNARTVWQIATQPYSEAHFATFPEELPRRCILAGCPAGGLVLDPFNGSGTTGAVAVKNGRNYIGLELNPEYIAMARDRIGRAARPNTYRSERKAEDAPLFTN